MVVFVWCARRDGERTFVRRADVHAKRVHQLGHKGSFFFQTSLLCRLVWNLFNRIQVQSPQTKRKKDVQTNVLFLLVREAGLEPARPE